MAWPIIAAMAASAASQLISNQQQIAAQKEMQQADLDARMRAARELRNQGRLTEQQYNKVIDDIKAYYSSRGSIGTRADVNEYADAIRGYNPSDYVADIGDFDYNYNKTKEDFLNPYYNAIIGDTAAQIQHSAAGAGLGRGTGAAMNIAQGVARKEDELYKTAMSEFRDDRDFAYKKYTDAIANNQNRLNALLNATKYGIDTKGTLAQDYMDTQDSQMSDILKAQQDKLNAGTAYGTAIAGLY